MKKPNGELWDCILEASNVIRYVAGGSPRFYVHRKDSYKIDFMGAALRDYLGRPAICFASNIYKLPREYHVWVAKHELRHLQTHPFRYHDITLWDIGWDKPKPFGFFWEDIKEISMCEVLRGIFKNISYTDTKVKGTIVNFLDFAGANGEYRYDT